jgi:hypothetical protein
VAYVELVRQYISEKETHIRILKRSWFFEVGNCWTKFDQSREATSRQRIQNSGAIGGFRPRASALGLVKSNSRGLRCAVKVAFNTKAHDK